MREGASHTTETVYISVPPKADDTGSYRWRAEGKLGQKGRCRRENVVARETERKRGRNSKTDREKERERGKRKGEGEIWAGGRKTTVGAKKLFA